MKLINIYLSVVVFCFAGVAFGWDNVVKPWQKLEKCRIVDSYGNDGDSFHVMHGEKEYVFRICFADCAETSMTYPPRIKDQADWWGISDKDVVKAGHDATDFTMKLLKGRSFTVYTKFKDARGNSALGRNFAMIKVPESDSYLSEKLVEAGLARTYGYAVATPDGMSRKAYRSKLDALEKKAKKDHVGAWKYAKVDFFARSRGSDEEAAEAAADKDHADKSGGEKIMLTEPVAFYSSDRSASFRGTLKAGTAIHILDKSDRDMIKVRAPLHGNMVEGKCRRYDLRKMMKSEQ
jgi:endonuclease YncB( thermonuclease family)